MRNQYLLGLGGALLATTTLSTAASAATVYNSTALNVTVNRPTTAIVSAKVSAQIFGTTGLTATSTLGPQNVYINFSNAYTNSLGPKIIVTPTGASFDVTAVGSSSAANLTLVSYTGATSTTITGTTTGTAAGCAVGVLTTQIQITSCAFNGTGATGIGGTASAGSFSIGGIGISGIVYTAATGLATAGATVTLGGQVVEQANPTNTFETITAATVITSVNSALVTVSSGTATAQLGTGTVAYTTVSQTVSGNASGGLTIVLAQIQFTGTGATTSDLSTTVAITSAAGNLGLTVTSAVLSDPAVANVRFVGPAVNITTAALSGTATFSSTSLTGAVLYSASLLGTNYVQVELNGTTSITGGAAGTLSGTFLAATSGSNLGSALASITGTASAVTRQGFQTQINSVQASTNTFVQSYVRITNGGSVAGSPIITVYNATTGAAMGTYNAASLAGYATVQYSAKDIETGAGVTAVVGGSYDLVITGTLPNGYVQHITGNPGGLFVDFSGRRQTNLGNN